MNVLRLGVDMMTISGSKIYGPKSIGALFIKNKNVIDPILFGGGQEFGLRSGTEDAAMIVGFAKALEISQEIKESEVERLIKLRDFLIGELLKDERVVLNGSENDRLPNNINVTVAGFSGELLVIQLAARGFAVSSKSACQSDSDEESHVIAALREAQGISSKSEEGSLRITMGRGTRKKDIERFLSVFYEILDNKI
jgi:cysteine desulfurase